MREQTDLVMLEELQEEGGHGGGDAYEEVDDDEEDVGRAGNLEAEGRWVHDGGDGPPDRKERAGAQVRHWSQRGHTC